MTSSTVAPSLHASPDRRVDVRRRAARLAASTYLAVWVAGLATAPTGPDPLTATATQLQTHATSNAAGLATQSMLVHGVAGLALLTVAMLLPVRLGNGRMARLARASGIVAAIASVTQTGLMLRIVTGVPGDTAATTARFFHAIDRVDSFKLLALGTMVAMSTWASRHTVHRRLVVFGALVGVLLPVSGAAFIGADALYSLLYVSLPLLLTWVMWFTVAITKPMDPTRRPK